MSRKLKKEKFENLEVIDINKKGKGVVKSESGQIIFVDGVVPGDLISTETYKKRKGYWEGNLIKINKKSSNRIKPICEHFGTCGGCKWQNLDYKTQLKFKQKEVLHNLKHIAKMIIPKIERIKKVNSKFFYRNKMEYSFSSNRWLSKDEIRKSTKINDKNALGLHKSGMWDKVVDINQCYLQKEPSNLIRNGLKEFCLSNKMRFYNLKKNVGFLRSMIIRNSSENQFMVLIQFSINDRPKIKKVMNFLKDNFKIESLLYCVNTKLNDSIYDQKIELFNGSDYIIEKMENLYFKINIKSFYQTNSDQAYELYKIIRDFADLTGEEIIYDLYTGTGTIAQFIANRCKKVVGIDIVKESIIAAKDNAIYNKIKNVFFELGDVKNNFNEIFTKKYGIPDIIITDPPRNGMDKSIINKILSISPNKLIYVSCNSSTQARDLSYLSNDYKMTRCRAVDMFPHTNHIENVVLLEKQ
ncbi:MAG: 23S rRNA (uracil(1939)-C(5))-methyltransferase RlmD [Flavobacteriaceae bacterium]|nr:23S rRNA (uracil(1939)-C(5))-methyltransferase RlmD [Flavobacteriaceae bacterium]